VEETAGDPEVGAERLRDLMTGACDCTMPRMVSRPHRMAYWWSQEIARLRLIANAKRKRLKRVRRDLRLGTTSRTEKLAAAGEFADASHALRREIDISKARA